MKIIRTVALVVGGLALTAGLALATPGSSVNATTFARGLLGDVKAHADGIKLKTDENTDVAVQKITFQAGGSSGWHSHPGVVLVTIASGTFEHFHGDCAATTYTAGQAFMESGDTPGLLRNGGATAGDVYVTYLAPHGVALRNDQPNPGCPTVD